MSDEHEAQSSAESTGDQAESETEEETASTGLQEGDFVRLAYTARTVEGGELVDTTDEEIAEEEGVDTEEQSFEPQVIVLGSNQLFEPVEEDIYGKEEGDTGSVVVQPEDAFGEYDQEEVRTISADKIPEDERYPGAHVEVEGEHGHVETIIGGRARVDFNHPLAGKEIEYEYEILEVVEDPLEKAQGLLNSYVDVDLDMEIDTDEVEEETEEGTETVEKRTLYIESVPQLQFNQQWMFSKQQVAQQLIDHLDIDRVIIQEIIGGEAAGPMGGMGGMMGGGGGELGDIEEAIEEEDVDTEEIVEELEDDIETEED